MSIRIRSSAVAVIAAASLSLVLGAGTARADDADGLEAQRARVKEALAHYEAGRYADAIVIWRGVYEELGPRKAYRISFNLARAYDKLGDATRAAERYASFLDEAESRRAAGETNPATEKYTAESKERLAALAAQHGRLRVAATTPPVLVRIDEQEPRLAGFTAFVQPGSHRVTFAVGTSQESSRELRVDRGAVVDVEAPRPQAERPAATATTPAPITQGETTHPFSPVILFVGAGVTLASAALPAVLYFRALDAKETFDTARDPIAKDQAAAEYEDRKSTTYVSLVVPISLAVITGALAAWYVIGTRTKMSVAPVARWTGGGLTGTF